MWKKLREKQRNRQECTTAAAVVRILGGKFLEVHNTPKQSKKKIVANATSSKCPQCGGNLVFEGGCNTCKDCGWSKCD